MEDGDDVWQCLELVRCHLGVPQHPSLRRVVRRCSVRLGLSVANDALAAHVDACMRRLGVAMPFRMPRLRPLRDEGTCLFDAALYPVAEITSTHARYLTSVDALRRIRIVLGREVGVLEWAGDRSSDNLFFVHDAHDPLRDARRYDLHSSTLSAVCEGERIPMDSGSVLRIGRGTHYVICDRREGGVAWLVLARHELPGADLHVYHRAITHYRPLDTNVAVSAALFNGHLFARMEPRLRGNRRVTEAAIATAPRAIIYAHPAIRLTRVSFESSSDWWCRAGAFEMTALLRRARDGILTDDVVALIVQFARLPGLETVATYMRPFI
jgi:hypothetical protein